jgi:hypothetical protein
MSENTENNEPKTIDEAITACEDIIFWHRVKSFTMLGLLIGVTVALYLSFKKLEQTSEQVCAVGGGVLNPEQIAAFSSKCGVYPYIFFAIFLATFGIIVAIYRFHMNEIARNEQIKVGFWRIRIAARNTSPGFQTEVRQSLTKDAFTFNRKVQSEKGKEVESPIPGHPASDFSATILNKILENMDVNISKKSK